MSSNHRDGPDYNDVKIKLPTLVAKELMKALPSNFTDEQVQKIVWAETGVWFPIEAIKEERPSKAP